jgi:hypothetical protein
MTGLTRFFAAIALVSFGTRALPAGETYVALVPWRVVEPHAKVDAPLALFWIPASAEELRRSDLLTSDDLTLFSSQCVAMRVVQLNDSARLTALSDEAEPPLAVLADRAGKVIGRVKGERGALSVVEVEELVRAELDRRAEESEAMLDRAQERVDANDVDAAAVLYRAVWEQKCVCPRQARAAKKALRKLGLK